MSIFKLKPAREDVSDVDLIADLDRLIAEPVGFVFQGKTHVIKPMSLEIYLKTSSAIAKLQGIQPTGDNVESYKKIVQAYGEIFASCCDTMTQELVEEMTLPQAQALLQVILEKVSGKDTDKKKT